MAFCWAQSLGDCGDETSKEHIVSGALWKSSSITVEGLSWCKGQRKTVGLNSLTAKILCKKHNNALSPLDSAGARAFDALASADKLARVRRGLSVPPRFAVTYDATEADLLERWFLKTCLNLTSLHTSDTRWRQTGAPLREPPPVLVEMAFGRRPILAPLGLYAAASPGELLPLRDEVGFAPLMYDGPEMIAGMFEFRGIRFLLHLEQTPLPSVLELPSSPTKRWSTGKLLYHLQNITWSVRDEESHRVHFHWPR